MTATLEAPEPVVEEKVDPIFAFKMPRPERGQAVTWYPSGEPKDGETAFVQTVGLRNIVLRTFTGMAVETVRHVTDPKLKLNADQRASGAWDFTDKDKADIVRDEKIASLTERLAVLEGLFNEPKKKKPD